MEGYIYENMYFINFIFQPPKTGGKITPATSTGRRPPSTRGRGGSAGSGAVSSPAPPTIDPVLDAKYKEKIYSQVLLGDNQINMAMSMKCATRGARGCRGV